MEIFFGAIIYADDIALMAPSHAGLQILMNICSEFGLQWDISFNPNKSQAMLIGCGCKIIPAPLCLSGGRVSWVEPFKYLGVMVKSHKCF